MIYPIYLIYITIYLSRSCLFDLSDLDHDLSDLDHDLSDLDHDLSDLPDLDNIYLI